MPFCKNRNMWQKYTNNWKRNWRELVGNLAGVRVIFALIRPIFSTIFICFVSFVCLSGVFLTLIFLDLTQFQAAANVALFILFAQYILLIASSNGDRFILAVANNIESKLVRMFLIFLSEPLKSESPYMVNIHDISVHFPNPHVKLPFTPPRSTPI